MLRSKIIYIKSILINKNEKQITIINIYQNLVVEDLTCMKPKPNLSHIVPHADDENIIPMKTTVDIKASLTVDNFHSHLDYCYLFIVNVDV